MYPSSIWEIQKFTTQPLAFQADRKYKKYLNAKYDLSFVGTLDRSKRATEKKYRRDVLIKLLEAGISVINFNGRANSPE